MSDMVGTSALHIKLNKLCATNSSAAGTSSPRRQSLDTQTRLFGAPDVTPRRVRDNQKSTIFAVDVELPKPSPKRTVPTFTSEGIYGLLSSTNGTNGNGTPSNGTGSTGSSNGVSPASSPVPSTPVRGNSNPGSRRPSLDTKNRLFNVETCGSDTSSECGSTPMPSTPVRVRQPPGGKSSGIF